MSDDELVFNRVTGDVIADVRLSPRRGDVRPYMFRANQLLVDVRDRDLVAHTLEDNGFRPAAEQVQAQAEPPAGEEAAVGSRREIAQRKKAVRKLAIEQGISSVLPKLGLELWVRPDALENEMQTVPQLVERLARRRPVTPLIDAPASEEQPAPGDQPAPAAERARMWPVYVAHVEPDGEFGPATAAAPISAAGTSPEGNAGKGVRIGVVDTGLFRQHEWLQRATSRGAPDDEILDDNGDGKPDFDSSHGSFVAGVIRRQAPGAVVVARAATDENGLLEDSAIADAIESLLRESIDILNLSLGGYVDPGDPEPFPATFRAIQLLRDENPLLVVVAAAGNDGIDQPFFPAASPDVIGVGALSTNLRRASFSNFGPWVDAWAQGVEVESCYDVDGTNASAGAIWSGTSFAAPCVSGALAAAMNPA